MTQREYISHENLRRKNKSPAHRFGLWSHDRCICGNKGDPNHCATVCPVTKPFHVTKSSAENLSTWCENIVHNRRSPARLMNIMKILHERRRDIIMDQERLLSLLPAIKTFIEYFFSLLYVLIIVVVLFFLSFP
ncbi:hypothetical protein AVEN_69254-1 [Araneus ventricosus]|uniref:Uncharacterized protein n=1 Tax=Araneus ventricosus TaxID=182803 RepID=A0A4Y2QD04_ARAVE|nr:hypothetical protein AVEN_69254-1 [Araneus ventricosus]